MISGGRKVLGLASRENLGEDFLRANNLFREGLEECYERMPKKLRKAENKLWWASAEKPEEEASPLHAYMKAFIWQYLWGKYKKKLVPEIEKEYGKKNPDVSIIGRGVEEFYEAETGYGTGELRAKLTEKVRKYNPHDNLNIIIPNLTILSHLRKLLRFRRDWKEERGKLEIYGLDLENGKLVPITRFAEKIKEIWNYFAGGERS